MEPVATSSPENSIRPFGYSTSDCGYCKGERASLLPGNVSPNDSSKSWGMLADAMSAKTYEEFIARGWRRSGTHLYKPCNFESCCPTLTIRLQADQFQMTKSQAKVMRKMQNLLKPATRKKQKTNQKSSEEQLIMSSGALMALSECTQQALMQCLPHNKQNNNDHSTNASNSLAVTFKVRKLSKQERKKYTIHVVSSVCAQVAGKLNLQRQNLVQSVVQALILPKNNDFGGLVSVISARAHEPSGQIVITLQLLENSNAPSDMDVSMMVEAEDKLAEFYEKALRKPLLSSQREVSVQTIAAHESALDPQVFKLYALYQHVVHDDPAPFTKEKSDQEEMDESPVPLSELDWGNAPKYFLDRVEPMLQQFCRDYDKELHDTIINNYYSYYQFLVEAPFPVADQTTPMKPPTCGNYHQHYKIGDLLIAVGVVDILPTGLSSVYLFYDPSFSHQHVALGKYAILKEVEYTHEHLPSQYYYLGYYIESCQKMRYKGEYKPSQLLCPKYYKWVDAELALNKLRQTPRHVCAFVEENEEEVQNERRTQDYVLNQIQMDIGAGLLVTFDMLQDSGKQVVKPILEEFVLEAGQKLSMECLLKFT
jgi:arginine-tRNA-protein transferase